MYVVFPIHALSCPAAKIVPCVHFANRFCCQKHIKKMKWKVQLFLTTSFFLKFNPSNWIKLPGTVQVIMCLQAEPLDKFRQEPKTTTSRKPGVSHPPPEACVEETTKKKTLNTGQATTNRKQKHHKTSWMPRWHLLPTPGPSSRSIYKEPKTIIIIIIVFSSHRLIFMLFDPHGTTNVTSYWRQL